MQEYPCALAVFIDLVWVQRWGRGQSELAKQVGIAPERLSRMKAGAAAKDHATVEGLVAASWSSRLRRPLLLARDLTDPTPVTPFPPRPTPWLPQTSTNLECGACGHIVEASWLDWSVGHDPIPNACPNCGATEHHPLDLVRQ